VPPRFLTLRDLYGGDESEAALTYPLPPDPDIALLFRVREKVLEYLTWAVPELELKDSRQAAWAIEAVCARLTEISKFVPGAIDADLERSKQIAAEFVTTTAPKNLEVFFRHEDHLGKDQEFCTAVNPDESDQAESS
jgi:hypothetical protein